MTLCDTGPLVALVDQDDSAYARCVAALGTLPASPLLTTWPCLVEAMYLLWRAGGLPAQEELWGYLADGLVVLHTPAEGTEAGRLRNQRSTRGQERRKSTGVSLFFLPVRPPTACRECPLSAG